MPSGCERPVPYAGKVRRYAFACGECSPCLLRAQRLEQAAPTTRAWIVALDGLAAPSGALEVERRALALLGRDAAAGGVHDTFSRAPFALADLGLVTPRVMGARTVWSVTSAGRRWLALNGHQPSAAAPAPPSLF